MTNVFTQYQYQLICIPIKFMIDYHVLQKFLIAPREHFFFRNILGGLLKLRVGTPKSSIFINCHGGFSWI